MDSDGSDKYISVVDAPNKTLQILNVAAFMVCMVGGGLANSVSKSSFKDIGSQWD